MWYIFFIPFIVFLIIFLSAAVKIIRISKKSVDVLKPRANDIVNNRNSVPQNENKNVTMICEYCGSHVNSSETKCPSCGAGLRGKK